jgi:putative DNA primase/helicase
VSIRQHLGGVARPSGLLNLMQHPGREMRIRPQWVCWRYEWDGSRWRKPPFHPLTGQKTDTTRPGQWATYKEAARAYLNGGYDGIGYVFFPGEGYTRLDFDHCRDPLTGNIDRWVLEILAFLNTYAEVSPSGDGLHVIARGQLHGRDRKTDGLGEHHHGALEMYSQAQNYLTWTNERLDGGTESIRECGSDLCTLYDIVYWEQIHRERVRERGAVARELPCITVQTEPRTPAQEKADTWLTSRARRAKNGQVFSRLYDELPGAGSQHEDDFRLCMMLLYWTQDSNGIPDLSWADRLYRHSQRYIGRWEKWDRRLGQYTYGQVTLYQAYLKRYIQFR